MNRNMKAEKSIGCIIKYFNIITTVRKNTTNYRSVLEVIARFFANFNTRSRKCSSISALVAPLPADESIG